MCARLLACPLCSQPGFLTLDALRAGLISVATRPLICPVCNEVLLGIDKLTIHLFSHTINLNGTNPINNKHLNVCTETGTLASIQNNVQEAAAFQQWNIPKASSLAETNLTDNVNLNAQANLESDRKNFEAKDKQVPGLERPGLEQNLTLNSVRQVVFVANQACDDARTSVFQESCASEGIRSETLPVNCTPPQYYSETNKRSVPDSYAQCQEQSIQTLKDWIQEQHCQQTIAENSVASLDSNKPGGIQINTVKEINRMETVKSGSVPSFDSFPKVIETVLEAQSSEEGEKQTVQRSEQNDSGKHEEEENLKGPKTPTAAEKTERCNICGFHFPDYNILLLHKQLVHMVEEKDLNVIPENYLKNYSCHLCSKVFKMRGSLMVHMRVAHVGHSLGSLHKDGQVKVVFNENGYDCPTCGKKFKKEQHVIQHLKTHEAKQWECEVCSKMFTTKYFLKKHKRLHSGEMPYKCNICNKTFTFQQSYHKHRLYHKDDKPHTCATCGRSFKELSTLHNHERIHTGEKPFACETCGKCFRQRVSYLVHRRIHTGVMPYKCTLCDKSFRYKVSQRTHKCPARQTNDSDPKQAQPPETQATHNETDRKPETNMQENQPILQMVENEKNKYILIINNQGQHVLTTEANAQNSQELENKLQSAESVNVNKENKGLSDQWATNIPNGLMYRKSVEASTTVRLENGKGTREDTNDFFSMVMVPIENEIPSPTSEMEHLRVSSPPKKEEMLEPYDTFKANPDDVQMNVVNTNLNGGFPNDRNANSLETINEESLKQLLYGINEK